MIKKYYNARDSKHSHADIFFVKNLTSLSSLLNKAKKTNFLFKFWINFLVKSVFYSELFSLAKEII